VKDLKTWMEYCEHLNFTAHTTDKKLSNLSKKFSWLAGFSSVEWFCLGRNKNQIFTTSCRIFTKNIQTSFKISNAFM